VDLGFEIIPVVVPIDQPIKGLPDRSTDHTLNRSRDVPHPSVAPNHSDRITLGRDDSIPHRVIDRRNSDRDSRAWGRIELASGWSLNVTTHVRLCLLPRAWAGRFRSRSGIPPPKPARRSNCAS